jgi:hypothetical protein
VFVCAPLPLVTLVDYYVCFTLSVNTYTARSRARTPVEQVLWEKFFNLLMPVRMKAGTKTTLINIPHSAAIGYLMLDAVSFYLLHICTACTEI